MTTNNAKPAAGLVGLIGEFEAQRNMLGGRAAQLAGELAAMGEQLDQARAEIAKRDETIAALEKKLAPVEPDKPAAPTAENVTEGAAA